MGQDAEAELLGRCRLGDAVAWDELFDKHYGPTGRFVFQLGHSFLKEDVEEICQETGLTLDPPSAAPSPDVALIHAEQSGLVHRALDRVGGPCREVIELRYFGDLSYDEIGDSLDLNPKTVSSRLSKCLDKLEEIAREIFSGEKSDLFPSNL